MNLLLAEDDPVTRVTLDAVLRGAGYDVTTADDGAEAWGAWQLAAHRIVLSDWLMPQLDGLELCRRIRGVAGRPYTYFILQTSRGGHESFLEAMAAGVDDFVTKPVLPDELRARLIAARRIIELRQELSALEGLLSVCSYCKRIRQSDGAWGSLERYIEQRSQAQFSHGVCPQCYDRHLAPHVGP